MYAKQILEAFLRQRYFGYIAIGAIPLTYNEITVPQGVLHKPPDMTKNSYIFITCNIFQTS